MRLKRLKLTSYRVHRGLEVHFTGRLNVIGGPNEAGKSTLAEALHRAFFLRASVTGNARDRMVTRPDGGHPEVEVDFFADGAEWTLHKRFSGTNGTIRLSTPGERTLSGDEAEVRLAGLLRGEDALGGRRAGRLDDKWAHLWVWQGSSGSDPVESLREQADHLIQRLQSMGGAALFVSERDSRVAAKVRERYDTLFTKTGKTKAGSELQRREEATEEAVERLEERRAVVRGLEGAAARFRDSQARLERARTALRRLEEERTELGDRIREAEDLERVREGKARELEENTRALSEARETDRRISELGQEVAELRARLDRHDHEVEALERERAERAAARRAGERAQEEAARTVRRTRRAVDLARARLQLLERRARLGELEAIRGQIVRHEDEIGHLRRRLSELAPVTTETLDALVALDVERTRAEDRLRSVAAEIELLEGGDRPVHLEGDEILPGTSRTVTREVELRIGEETRLRVRPGGGSEVEDVRRETEARASELSRRLEDLGCASLDEARHISRERQRLETERVRLDSVVEELAGEGFDARLRRAEEQWHEARGTVTRLTGSADGEELAADESEEADPHTLAGRLEVAERALADSEAAERDRGEDVSARARALELSERALRERREADLEVRRALDGKASNLELLEEQAGNAARRAERLGSLERRAAERARALAETEAALARLDPEQLEKERIRLDRALERQRDEEREADKERAAAGALLDFSGTRDPYTELKSAHAAVEQAREAERTARARADAVRLLHETFEAEKRALDRSLVAPLEERANRYLQLVLGGSSRVALPLDGTALAAPSLRRDERFEFEELSGGAREQVAVAIRLAAAELLAQDHDGGLPMVLDDAFAYADPERIAGLVRALDHAAERGLQIVLLTCTPADYAGLGAAQVHLPRPPGD